MMKPKISSARFLALAVGLGALAVVLVATEAEAATYDCVVGDVGSGCPAAVEPGDVIRFYDADNDKRVGATPACLPDPIAVGANCYHQWVIEWRPLPGQPSSPSVLACPQSGPGTPHVTDYTIPGYGILIWTVAYPEVGGCTFPQNSAIEHAGAAGAAPPTQGIDPTGDCLSTTPKICFGRLPHAPDCQAFWAERPGQENSYERRYVLACGGYVCEGREGTIGGKYTWDEICAGRGPDCTGVWARGGEGSPSSGGRIKTYDLCNEALILEIVGSAVDGDVLDFGPVIGGQQKGLLFVLLGTTT